MPTFNTDYHPYKFLAQAREYDARARRISAGAAKEAPRGERQFLARFTATSMLGYRITNSKKGSV